MPRHNKLEKSRMPIVTLANNKQFECAVGSTILEAAIRNGLMLEYSCRSGRCGVCKARIVSGQTISIQAEESLRRGPKDESLVLTCCRTATADVWLDIEDLGRLAGVEVRTLPCRIDSLDMLAPDVIHLTLRLPPSATFFYLPGQYIDLIHGSIRRSYSIANSARADGILELHVRRVASGVMSEYLFTHAKKNDLLRLEGPLGSFHFRETSNQNIVFLATGTGIAPVRAILEELASRPQLVTDKKIFVYWGGRTSEDLYWRPDFPELNLKFYPLLSRADPSWPGRVGYVQSAVVEDNIKLESAVIYACGSTLMIESAHQLLLEHGLDPSKFYSDAFVSSS